MGTNCFGFYQVRETRGWLETNTCQFEATHLNLEDPLERDVSPRSIACLN